MTGALPACPLRERPWTGRHEVQCRCYGSSASSKFHIPVCRGIVAAVARPRQWSIKLGTANSELSRAAIVRFGLSYSLALDVWALISAWKERNCCDSATRTLVAHSALLRQSSARSQACTIRQAIEPGSPAVRAASAACLPLPATTNNNSRTSARKSVPREATQQSNRSLRL